jgi:hypothetical protein
MKKFIWFLAGMMFATAVTVFASGPAGFLDQDSFDDWYLESALSMKARGVILGDNDGNFNASGYVDRAQMAVMLDRTVIYLREEILGEVESNNVELLDTLFELDFLKDGLTDVEIAYVSVLMGDNIYDETDEWNWSIEYLVDDDCDESDLIVNGDVVDGYTVYRCYDIINDNLYINQHLNDVWYGFFAFDNGEYDLSI